MSEPAGPASPLSPPSNDKWIGRSHERVGARDRVTGAQHFIADIHLDHVLHVKLVHLPIAHARIVSIDATAATASRCRRTNLRIR